MLMSMRVEMRNPFFSLDVEHQAGPGRCDALHEARASN